MHGLIGNNRYFSWKFESRLDPIDQINKGDMIQVINFNLENAAGSQELLSRSPVKAKGQYET